MKEKTVHICFPGGIVPITSLRQVAMVGISHGMGCVYSGDRQHLRMAVQPPLALPQARVLLRGIDVRDPSDGYQNVVSNTQVSATAKSTPWLSSGRFRTILDTLKAPRKIGIDLIDPLRPMVLPGFGQLRFYAHPEEDFWIPSVRTLISHGAVHFPIALRSADLPTAIEALESLLLWRRHFNASELIATLERALPDGFRPLNIPGLTQIAGPDALNSDDAEMLRIPLDDAPFSCRLLESLCMVCERHGVAFAGLTSQRELVFSGLDEIMRQTLEFELVRFRWRSMRPLHMPKIYFSDRFLAEGPVAKSLQEAVRQVVNPFARRSVACILENGAVPEADLVTVLHRTEGHPFTRRKISLYHQTHGPGQWGNSLDCLYTGTQAGLIEVLRRWVEASGDTAAPPTAAKRENKISEATHICGDCLTHYNAAYGDPLGGIAAGTPFEHLDNLWRCPVCGAPKKSFDSRVNSA